MLIKFHRYLHKTRVHQFQAPTRARIMKGLGCMMLVCPSCIWLVYYDEFSRVYIPLVYGVLVPLVQSNSRRKEEWKAPKSKRWYSIGLVARLSFDEYQSLA